MKLKVTLLVIALSIASLSIFAEVVKLDKAKKAAKNAYAERTGINQSKIVFSEIHTVANEKGEPYYYIFNLDNNHGFIIISAEDKIVPVLGYSETGYYDINNENPSLAWWMGEYRNAIEFTRNKNIKESNEAENQWLKYTQDFSEFVFSEKTKGVDPLLGNMPWDQGSGWNAYCPEDPAGPSGHVYAGCVATATSMVMKYYNYPIHGTGANSYYLYPYGTISANFGTATYDFPLMSKTQATDEAAYLMFHVGVSVNMGYSPNGSGAYTSDVPYSLENYFGYNTSASYKMRQYYTSQWPSMLETNLDNDIPLVYSGHSTSGGHAWVCDGYNDNSEYHMNWGWSGSQNGYFTIADMNGYTSNQAAIFDIKLPNDVSFPSVTNLSTNVDFNDVTLSWDSPSPKDNKATLDGLKIFRDGDDISGLIDPTTTSYIDTTLGTTSYSYNVVAYYSSPDGFSADNYISATVSASYNLHFDLSQQSGNPIPGASITVETQPLPTTKTTDDNGETSFENIYEVGWMNYEIEVDGYPEIISDSVYLSEPDVYVDLTLDYVGINKNSIHADYKVYPNPVNDQLTVKSPVNGTSGINIMDVTGKNVIEFNTSEKEFSINVSELSQGMYFLRIKNQKGNFVKKIFVE